LNINFRTMALVFAGGTLGTLLRTGVAFGLDSFTSLAAVNVVGSAVIGWLNSDPRFATEGKRAFWAIGFAGGFTTMSGVALLSASGLGSSFIFGGEFSYVLLGLILAIFAASLLAYWGAHALTARLTGNDAVVSHEVEEVTE
jgi:CrcB protein